MISRTIGYLLVAFPLLFLSGNSAATLIGDTVDINLNGFTESYLVQDGIVEDTNVFDFDELSLDFEESSILMTFLFTSNFTANVDWVFSSLDWVGQPGGIIVDILLSNDLSGTVTSSFTEHSVTLSFTAVQSQFVTGETIAIDLITNHAVPEPESMFLFCIGLLGLIFLRIIVKEATMG